MLEVGGGKLEDDDVRCAMCDVRCAMCDGRTISDDSEAAHREWQTTDN
jgi:hypothetical protein